MGAFTLSGLIWLEAARRPRALLATLMLALSAGFLILPDPAANYATLTLKGHPLIYTPAVMGFITGGEFAAFSGALGVLAMTVVAPMAAWRAIWGVAAAPAWRVALGIWVAAFGVGLFLLTCIWAGALPRAYQVLILGGEPLRGLWIFSSWAYGLGIAGAAVSATLYTLLAMRLATRPGLFMAATFVCWVAVLSPLASGAVLNMLEFGGPRFIAHYHSHDLGMGIMGGSHSHAAVATLAVGDLFSTPGGGTYLLGRLAFVAAALALTLVLSGPRLRPLISRARSGGWSASAMAAAISARFGLTGVIFRQIWSARPLTLAALATALVFEALHTGDPVGVIALGFAWGLYMLRWPELCAAFEHGALRNLIVPSVLGPWPVRAQLWGQIALQAGLLALPLGLAFAGAGRVHAMVWLAAQVVGAPLLCVCLSRLRAGATLFSLTAMAWWYLLVSGNLPPPLG